MQEPSPPRWHCALMASCSTQKRPSLQFFCQQQLAFNFQVQLIKIKTIFILAKYPSFPDCHIFFIMKYIQLFLKYMGLIFLQQTLNKYRKIVYIFVIYDPALDRISEEHSRSLSR